MKNYHELKNLFNILQLPESTTASPNMELPLDRAIGSRMSADLETADDYRRLRKRISRELLVLKKDLLLVNKDTKNYQSHDKTKDVTAEDFDRDERYATVFLLTAERDYLYAMEIRAKLDVANAGASSYMKLMRTRLKRAIYNFKRIVDIFGSLSPLKKLEYYVYGALLEGHYALTRKKWSVAIYLYSVARCCLDLLLDKLRESSSDVFDSTILTDILENTVIPSTKFAVVQERVESPQVDLTALSRKRCHDNLIPLFVPAINIIDKEFANFATYTEVELDRTIVWRDHEAEIYNDELARKIMEVKEMPQDNMDEVSDAWAAALNLFLANDSQDDDDIERVQNKAIVKTYINYHMLFARLKNTQGLRNDNTNHSRILDYLTKQSKYFSELCAIIEEVKELPGVYNDDELFSALELLILYFNAEKLEYWARFFEQKTEYSKALKLYNHIRQLVDFSANKISAIDSLPYAVVSREQLSTFVRDIEQKLKDVQIGAQFQYEAEPPVKTTIVENIDSYSRRRVPLDITSLRPMLSKPVLFDIAFNYINYAQTGSKTAVASAAPAAAAAAAVDSDEKKRGGSSFFGIFGGRS